MPKKYIIIVNFLSELLINFKDNKYISNEMLLAASHALAMLAKEPVPQSVLNAYSIDSLVFGANYLIPKPFDPRLIDWVASAVRDAYKDE